MEETSLPKLTVKPHKELNDHSPIIHEDIIPKSVHIDDSNTNKEDDTLQEPIDSREYSNEEFHNAIQYLDIEPSAPVIESDYDNSENYLIYNFGDDGIDEIEIPKYYDMEGFKAPPPTLEAIDMNWVVLGNDSFLSSDQYDSGVPASPIQLIHVNLETVHTEIHSQFKVRFRSNRGTPGPLKDTFYDMVDVYFHATLDYSKSLQKLQDLIFNRLALFKRLWQPMLRNITFPPQKCKDGITHAPQPFSYTIYILNEATFAKLGNVIHEYTVQYYRECGSLKLSIELGLSKIQSFIDDFLCHSQLFGKITNNDPISTCGEEDLTPLDHQDIDRAKHYIDVLFHFLRISQSNADLPNFHKQIAEQLSKLVAPLLRVSTLKTQVFILNQLVYCKNLDERCISFVQTPAFESKEFMWKSAGEYIYKLTLFFSPVVYIITEELNNDTASIIKRISDLRLSSDDDQAYVLSEQDYLMLFTQLRFSEFVNILFSDVTDADADLNMVMAEFEATLNVCEDMISVFADAVVHFKLYRHFSNRISEAMVRLLDHLGEYANNVLEMFHHLGEHFKSRIDRLFIFAFKTFHREPILWQFLVNLPYKYLYRSSAVYMFISIYMGKEIDYTHEQGEFKKFEDWIKERQRDNLRDTFALKLSENNYGEFLLHALSHLAVEHSYDVHLVLATIYEIYMISQVVESTKELYAKFALPILGHIFSERPKITSFLLRLIHSTEDLDSAIIRIFNFIPLDEFKPTEDDITVLSEWLRMEDVTSPNILMALTVIDRINWEFDEKMQLFQDPKIHQLASIAIAKANIFNTEKMPYLLKNGRIKFQRLAEDRIFLMKHFDLLGNRLSEPISLQVAPASTFYDLIQNYKAFDPVLAYIVLQISDIMTTPTLIETKGMPLFKNLIYYRKKRAILRLIYDHSPSIAKMLQARDHLPFSFYKDVCMPLITSSSSIWGVGSNDSNMIVYIISMITKQINDMVKYEVQGKDYKLMLHFWTLEVFKEDGWHKNPMLCSLLDQLFKLGIYYVHDNSVLAPLTHLETQYPDSLLSSLLFKSNKTVPTMLGNILGNVKKQKIEHIYLIYVLLLSDTLRLRKKWVQLEQLEPHTRLSIETMTHKLVYHIIQTIEAITDDHPIYILLWQLFFVLYFTYHPSGYFLSHSILSHVEKSKKVKMRSMDDIRASLTHLSKHAIANNPAYTVLCAWLNLNVSQIPIPVVKGETLLSVSNVHYFRGLEDIWFMLVNKRLMKEEIESSRQLWANETKTVSTNKAKPTQARSISRGRIERFKHAPSVLSPYVVKNHGHSLKHPEAFRYILQDLETIHSFDIHLRNTTIKEHYNLLVRYTNLYSKKYKHSTQVDERSVRCIISCKGPAVFHYTYNIPYVTEKYTSQKGDILNALLKYEKISNLSFEPVIDAILRLDKTFTDKKDGLSPKKGAKIFYIINEESSKLNNTYSPIRASLESLMTILYRNYMMHDPSHLNRSLQLILSSEKNHFMVDMFQPNLDPQAFVSMYKTVLSKHKAFESTSMWSKLLSRFDVRQWLEDYSSAEEQRNLMTTIVNYMLMLDNGEETLLNIVKSQLQSILLNQFPLNLNSLVVLALDKKETSFTERIWPMIFSLPLDTLEEGSILEIYQILAQCAKQAVSNVSAFPYYQQLVEALMRTLVSKKDVDSFRLDGITLNLLPIYETWILEFTHQYVMDGFVSCVKMLVHYSLNTLSHIWNWFTQFTCSNPLKLIPEPLQNLFTSQWASIAWNTMPNAPEIILSSVNQICRLYRGKPLFTLVTDILTKTILPMESDLFLRTLMETIILITSSHPWPLPASTIKWLGSIKRYPWYCMQGSEMMKSDVVKDFLYKYTQPPALVPQEKPTQRKQPRNNYLTIPIGEDVETYQEEDFGRLHLAIRMIRYAFCWEYASDANLNPILAAGIVDLLVLYVSFIRNLLPFCLSLQAKAILSESYLIIKNISHVLLTAHPEGTENHHKVQGMVFMLLQENMSIFNAYVSPSLFDAALDSLFEYLEYEPKMAWMVMKVANGIQILQSQIKILEKCIEVDIQLYCDWYRIASNIVIPEIQQQEYIQHCLDIKAGYMLYVHCIQVTHRFQKPDDLIAFLLDVQKWTSFIGGSLDHKSVLIYMKILSVIVQGFKICDDSDHLTLQHQLEHYFDFFDHESKSKEGFWVTLGLGSKSQNPSSFRVIGRYIVLYLIHQMPLDGTLGYIRLKPNVPLFNTNNKISKMIQSMSNEKETKAYMTWAMSYIQDSRNTIMEIVPFIMQLAVKIYNGDIVKILEKMV